MEPDYETMVVELLDAMATDPDISDDTYYGALDNLRTWIWETIEARS